jgi:hypothetical protein
LLELAATSAVGNASLTRLVRSPTDGSWRLAEFGSIDHLHQHGVSPTTHGAEIDAGTH